MNTPAALFRLACVALVAFACLVAALPAQTPPPPAKRLPPAGVAIPDDARAELTAGAASLRKKIDALATRVAGNSALVALLPDIEVFHKAVDWALRYDEFFDVKQVAVARHLLQSGTERVAELRGGRAPWTESTGLVIRGYRSRLDGSFQPYALVIPADWKPADQRRRRLDVVLAGRGEKRSELAFIDEHEKKPGEIVPPDGIVLHPYGRYCNATKFAGETDVFEAMAAVRRSYPIDSARIVVRGFSMGGASTWHLATHYPGLWAAAAPGAGFAETAVYNKALAPGKPERTWWEQTLWRWYDATGYAANLFSVPTVAYSGEIDPQKQAADIMEKSMAAEGLKLEHLVGPQTAHKYHPAAKATLVARLKTIVAKGRDAWPQEDHLTTFTPRYSTSSRLTIEELEKVWDRADVHARFTAPAEVEVTTTNVALFSVLLPTPASINVNLDGQRLTGMAGPAHDVSPNGLDAQARPGEAAFSVYFLKRDGRWSALSPTDLDVWRKTTRKRTGLSGPIDDAFMDPFLFVRPTGQPLNATVGAWAAAELQHATKMWRDIFRGDVILKDDVAVTEDDLATRHVVVFGDAASNRLLARILSSGSLPLGWDKTKLTFRGKTYDAAHHAPVLIFPNPLSGNRRYVVLNSGIDFRNEAYGTNSLQVPKLPDFAIVDLREPPGPRWPGKIVDAGFFDSSWK